MVLNLRSIPHFDLSDDLDACAGTQAGCPSGDHFLCILGRADAARIEARQRLVHQHDARSVQPRAAERESCGRVSECRGLTVRSVFSSRLW